MDGIFVAHHNTKQLFGFQYIPVEDMDIALCDSPALAESAFRVCVATMQHILESVATEFPLDDVRLSSFSSFSLSRVSKSGSVVDF